MEDSYLCGYLKIKGLTEVRRLSDPNGTYFELISAFINISVSMDLGLIHFLLWSTNPDILTGTGYTFRLLGMRCWMLLSSGRSKMFFMKGRRFSRVLYPSSLCRLLYTLPFVPLSTDKAWGNAEEPERVFLLGQIEDIRWNLFRLD